MNSNNKSIIYGDMRKKELLKEFDHNKSTNSETKKQFKLDRI